MRCANVSQGLLNSLFAVAIAAASGCDREPGEGRSMPPATAWKPPPPQPSRVEPGGAAVGGAGRMTLDAPGDPHAGLDLPGEGDPHASPTGDQDPHAGLDMGGGEGAEDPAMAGMNPPDPDRPIDASKFLRGTIRADKEVAAAIRSGAVLFLSAWPVNPSTGELLGTPLAVAKLDLDKLPVAFELSERDVMVDGTRFEGEVLVSARVDGDGEARTKEPGDVEGRIRARIPASGLDLVLDTALR